MAKTLEDLRDDLARRTPQCAGALRRDAVHGRCLRRDLDARIGEPEVLLDARTEAVDEADVRRDDAARLAVDPRRLQAEDPQRLDPRSSDAPPLPATSPARGPAASV